MLQAHGLQQLRRPVDDAEPDAQGEVLAAQGLHLSAEDHQHHHGGDGEPDGEEVGRGHVRDEVADQEERGAPDGRDRDEQDGGEPAGADRAQTTTIVTVEPFGIFAPAAGLVWRTVPKTPPSTFSRFTSNPASRR